MFLEYPKGLSKGDDWVIVHNAEEEAMARSNGYRFAGDEDDDKPEPKRKPGRPPKVSA